MTAQQRKGLDKGQFAIPEKAPGSGSYPIPDEAHARNALARVAQHGSPEEQARVKKAVKRKFPNIGDTDTKESKTGVWTIREAMKDHSEAGFADMSPAEQRNHMTSTHGVGEDSPSLRKPVTRAAKHASDHAANDNDADDAKESADLVIDGDFVKLVEKAVGRDGVMHVKMIQPGWGSSGYYPREVLERDAAKAYPQGAKMFLDHPTTEEERQRPERSVRDLAAVTTEAAHYLESGPDGPGIYAHAKPISEEHAKVLENLAPHIGVSIRAAGKARKGEVEGRKGNIIEAIIQGQSCDFVTEPGAGGKVLQQFMEAKRQLVESTSSKEEDDEVEIKEALSKLKEVEQERDRYHERLVLRDAQDFALRVLESEDTLPKISLRRVAESVSSDPPLDEFGELDKKKFKAKIDEAVRAESRYIENLRPTGRVRGLGRDNDSWEDEDGDDGFFSESRSRRSNRHASDDDEDSGFESAFSKQLQRIGVSESAAKIAAAGR